MIVFSAGTIAAIDAGQRIEKVTTLLLLQLPAHRKLPQQDAWYLFSAKGAVSWQRPKDGIEITTSTESASQFLGPARCCA